VSQRAKSRFPKAHERFGDNVEMARASRQLTQEQLAFESGVHSTYISQLESGQRNPTLDVILALAAALKTEPGNLFEGVKAKL
jgi:transcriptional regulator with XRE-family HTH domain